MVMYQTLIIIKKKFVTLIKSTFLELFSNVHTYNVPNQFSLMLLVYLLWQAIDKNLLILFTTTDYGFHYTLNWINYNF